MAGLLSLSPETGKGWRSSDALSCSYSGVVTVRQDRSSLGELKRSTCEVKCSSIRSKLSSVALVEANLRAISSVARFSVRARPFSCCEVVLDRLLVMFVQILLTKRNAYKGRLIDGRSARLVLSHPTGEDVRPGALEQGRGPNVEFEHDRANQYPGNMPHSHLYPAC